MEVSKLVGSSPSSPPLSPFVEGYKEWLIVLAIGDSKVTMERGGGGGLINMIMIKFLGVLGYTGHFKRQFFYLCKNNNFGGMVEIPPPPFGKSHQNYFLNLPFRCYKTVCVIRQLYKFEKPLTNVWFPWLHICRLNRSQDPTFPFFIENYLVLTGSPGGRQTSVYHDLDESHF